MQTEAFLSLAQIRRRVIDGPYSKCMFNCPKNCKAGFQRGYTVIRTLAMHVSLDCSISSPAVGTVSFTFVKVILKDGWLYGYSFFTYQQL